MMGIIYTSKGKPIFVDDDMVCALSLLRWRIQENGYVVAQRPTRYGKGNIYMHRLIAVPPSGMEVDHVDGNKRNNTSSNLRICTHEENCANRGKDSRNTSGYKGVNWDASRGKWLARIKHGGRQVNLGRFESAEEAYAVYCRKAATLKGEFVNYG